MEILQKHNMICWFAAFKRVAVVVALICLTATVTSCRTMNETQIVIDTVATHDTTNIFVHDTTIIKEVKIDSVDRYVEKTVYVDTNGVVHEKEVEKLTRYIYLQDEQYKVMEYYYKRKISELNKKLEENTNVEYVEKDLSWFQKTMIILGWCFIATLVIAGVCLYFEIKMKKKIS